MDPATTFHIGSPTHLVTLFICVVLTIGILRLAKKGAASTPPWEKRLRLAVAVGCVVSWLLSNGYGFFAETIDWALVLPLHFCNLANLVAAHALLTRHRTSQSLLYFWCFGLCVWAFLTPNLTDGPTTLWFWFFWLYHFFIPLSALYILWIDRFVPGVRDWRNATLLTLLLMGLLIVLNAFTGWNYGFVGRGLPAQPSPLDALGPYPIRLLWIGLIGTGVFSLLLLPWLLVRKRSA